MEIQTIEYISGHEIDKAFEEEWSSLFSRCYKSSINKASLLFRKYKLNDSRFCILRYQGDIVACYSGIKLSFNNSYIFLSTDTMSDGTVSGASVILGKHIYNILVNEGVFAVCGFPNEQIRKIRQKRLGWTILGALDLYISLPFFNKFFRSKKSNNLWRIVRPDNGFFSQKYPYLNLLGRDGLYSNGLGLIVTLSAYKPGLFFFRIPKFLVSPKIFGYKLLKNDEQALSLMNSSALNLDLDTIDIP
jgi:hypothetical protein